MQTDISLNILLVDDRTENLYSLEALLSDLEYDINFLKAESGKEALKLAYSNDIAVILLDVQMPEMDGFAVAEILKENKKTKSIPIIFVTAISKEEIHVTTGYKSGAVDYLFKPLNPFITCSKVKCFIDIYLMQKELENSAIEIKKFTETLEELANITSHGMQAPIRTIAFSAHNLESKYRGQLDEQGEDLIHNIKVSSRRMKTLINKLLTYSGKSI